MQLRQVSSSRQWTIRKSTIATHPPEEQHQALQDILKGTLLGGQPDLVTDTQFLGVQEMSGILASMVALKQVEEAGAMAAMVICRRTIELNWTLPARKLYLERAQMKIQSLLPLVIPSPMAAARLTTMQGRWAKLILMGKS